MDWGDFYDIAVAGWGFAPSEFWQMTPEEFWRIYEVKRPRDPEIDYAGGLSDETLDELWAEFYDN